MRRYYSAGGDELFWASDYEVSVWLSGLPNDSAFLRPFIQAIEARQEQTEQARRDIRERIGGAPTF